MTQKVHTILLVTGDQLSLSLSALRAADKATTRILMAEVRPEATTAKHHKKKIIFVFSAMRHFCELLREEGWMVDYTAFDDVDNSHSLRGEVQRATAKHGASRVLMTSPNDYRLRKDLEFITQLPDDRFFCSDIEFADYVASAKSLRMEFFYRTMRRKTEILMEGDAPVGGQWNFDSENRKPAKAGMRFHAQPKFEPDQITHDVITLVKQHFPNHYGLAEPFWFGVTRAHALAALESFIAHRFINFGATQDAMLQDQPFMNHSLISHYLNFGLLEPLEVCKRAEQVYLDGAAPLAAVEGFIRQILGWREYVRGIYWLKMPGYLESNALGATRAIPDFYWSGNTQMNCMAQALKQTHDEAYAHHIQRLMITGNFALLAGINPAEVHDWYHAVYIDALEWVEAPNTIGMALHGDYGLMGSKPYAASANYINKMSNYCGNCRYDPKQRLGPDACPFNALYWNFIATHREVFAKNPRMSQTANSYQKMSEGDKADIKTQAEGFLAELKPYRV